MIRRFYYSIIDNKRTVARWVMPVLLLGFAMFMAARALSNDDLPEEGARTLSGKVKRVYSGHSLKLDKDEDNRIRLAGIRAPYSHEPLFEESRDRLGYLLLGQRIRLRFDEVERDGKDRPLAYVFQNSKHINAEMVRQGLAYVRLNYETRRYEGELLDAQAEAQRKKRGLWKGMDWNTANSFAADPKYGSFHTPTCEEVDKINPSRLVIYQKKARAFEAGLAPCSKCLP